MTDTLRTRIAAALREVDDMRVCKLSDADIKFMADAVIAELGRVYEDSLRSSAFAALRLIELRPTPRHFTQEADE